MNDKRKMPAIASACLLAFALGMAPAHAASAAPICPVVPEIVAPDHGPALTAADAAALCSIVTAEEGTAPVTEHVAQNLDWENAFGIRYNDFAKLTAFFHGVVAPLQATSTSSTLEIKVRSVGPGIAIADEYWHVVGQLDVETRKPGPDRWGRTTYIFTKNGDAWTDIVERVADLRYPYYQHYDALPSPAALPSSTLDGMAGTYAAATGHPTFVLTRNVDRFDIASHSKHYVGIPASATEILLFDPTDLAEYYKLTLSASGPAFSDEAGTESTPMTKKP